MRPRRRCSRPCRRRGTNQLGLHRPIPNKVGISEPNSKQGLLLWTLSAKMKQRVGPEPPCLASRPRSPSSLARRRPPMPAASAPQRASMPSPVLRLRSHGGGGGGGAERAEAAGDDAAALRLPPRQRPRAPRAPPRSPVPLPPFPFRAERCCFVLGSDGLE
jgi:hypothetical protein